MSLKWVFFVGAHCTVTPAIVSAAEANRRLIRNSGTQILLPKEIREYLAVAPGSSGSAAQKKAAKSKLPTLVNKVHKRMSCDGTVNTVLLIEEALLGSCRVNTRTGILYPNIKSQIKGIPKEMDNPWNTICFCIKPYHDFFEQCYIRSPGIAEKTNVDAFREQVLGFSRSWIHVVEDITDHLPNIGIQIWRSDQTDNLKASIEEKMFAAAANILPYGMAKPGKNEEISRKLRSSFWSDGEISRCKSRFEEDWYYLETGWSDCLLR